MKAPIGHVRFWLVVEDDDLDFDLFVRASFRVSAPLVHREVNGVAAKEFLELCPDPPHLIVSDLSMPKMNGLTFLRWVRCQPGLAHVPFVMLTSVEVPEYVDDALRLGADAFWPKPLAGTGYSGLAKDLMAFRMGADGLLAS